MEIGINDENLIDDLDDLNKTIEETDTSPQSDNTEYGN